MRHERRQVKKKNGEEKGLRGENGKSEKNRRQKERGQDHEKRQ